MFRGFLDKVLKYFLDYEYNREKMKKRKILFVCNYGEARSYVAEQLFSPLFETKSAGVYAKNSGR